MTLQTWLLFGHILSAVVWVGGGLMLSVLGSRASSDASAIAEFARTLAYAGPRVLGPGSMGTLVFGVALVITSDSWDFSQPWVGIGLSLFALAFLIGAVFLSRIGLQLQRTVSEKEPDPTEGRRLLERWVFGYRLVLVTLLLAVWDMVFKPQF